MIKDNHIPTIQIKHKKLKLLFKANEYLESSKGEVVDLYVTNVDLELIKKHYDLYELEYLEGWKFAGRQGLFKKYIDRWAFIKENSEGAIRELAKLMLNNLYGKFATNPDVTGKVPYLKPDGSNGFKLDEEEFKDPEYTPMGVFITSYAREITISTAQLCYDRIIYCDTDSVHLVGTVIPDAIKDIINPKKMGYWDFEREFIKGRYLKQKTYTHIVPAKEVEIDGEIKIVECKKSEATTELLSTTCAGMSDEVKKNVTWDNFKIGFSAYGNLKGKQVSGGVVLNDSEFSIK